MDYGNEHKALEQTKRIAKPSDADQVSEQKSLLILKIPSGMFSESAWLDKYMEEVGQRIGAQVLITDDRMDVEWRHDLSPLIDAIQRQTAAINNLAASNMALVEQMASQQDEDQDPDADPQPMSRKR